MADTYGGEYRANCSFCERRGGLTLWPVRGEWGEFACEGCGRGGSAIDYLGRLNSLKCFDRILEQLMLGSRAAMPGISFVERPERVSLLPPGEMWQRQARGFVDEAKKVLWSSEGASAREWLKGAGFTDETIESAGLGLNLNQEYHPRSAWGLPMKEDRRKGGYVNLPRGLVVPHFIRGELWNVRIRLFKEPGQQEARYARVAGTTDEWTTDGLFNVDALESGRPAVILEDELEALLIQQDLGGIIRPVATGHAFGARRLQWYQALSKQRCLLTAFQDQRTARHWQQRVLTPTEPLPRYWNDVTEIRGAKEDVSNSILEAIERLRIKESIHGQA